MKDSKSRLFTYVSILLILCMSIVLATSCSGSDGEEPGEEPAEIVQVATNPLTGETAEDGFDENALNQRIAAFVVENTPDARPQWGLDDPNYSPDIVLQGEVEGGITRTLWFYADYNKLPEVIGPMRSARPPYIRFSELFDSVFIHWGQSSSKGDYVGANTIFRKHKVDHINQMTFNDQVGLYDRDHTRGTAIEHRGILYGSKVPAALKQEGFREEPKDYTHLKFGTLGWITAFDTASAIGVRYSDRASSQSTYWTYNEEDQKYHTSSFENDFSRDNLLVLYDNTEYIEKYNYGGSGASVVYCDYKFKGGKGKLFSKGLVKDIEWKREDGKLVLIDTELTRIAQERAAAEEAAEEAEDQDKEDADDKDDGEEEEPIIVQASLNKGKTWIGWISANNGGSIDIQE
ncbi:MAG: DUF3048 domain-containing protein [Mogibacterium sp.]|nr:DUF3048 domain-containing protein [Mogibacterium sp.]